MVLVKVLGIILGLALVSSLVLYGMMVHFEADINGVGQKTRVLNEENKELQVNLNRIQSFKNVEKAAEKVPNLHLSEETIEVMAPGHQKFPAQPKRQGDWPRVQGY